jgi:hypothetical protein
LKKWHVLEKLSFFLRCVHTLVCDREYVCVCVCYIPIVGHSWRYLWKSQQLPAHLDNETPLFADFLRESHCHQVR